MTPQCLCQNKNFIVSKKANSSSLALHSGRLKRGHSKERTIILLTLQYPGIWSKNYVIHCKKYCPHSYKRKVS